MNKKIECIKRLVDMGMFHEFITWFLEHKLITSDSVVGLERAKERSEFIYATMKRAEADNDLILLYFEWTLLPLETIKISCATATEKKEFTYGL